MYAIVEIQGQQFKAEAGKYLFVHHIAEAKKGETVEFDKVLLVDAEGAGEGSALGVSNSAARQGRESSMDSEWAGMTARWWIPALRRAAAQRRMCSGSLTINTVASSAAVPR